MTLLNRLLLPKQLGFKKNRLYHQSRVDFYEGRNSLTRLTSLKNLIAKDSLHTSNSLQQIQIQNIPFGVSTREIQKLKGTANYHQKNKQALSEIDTLFYRENLYGVTCIIQLQLFNDQFFFGNIELRHNTHGFGEKIEKLIQEKYGIDHLIKDTITDQNGHQIRFSNGLIPNISYLSGDKDLRTEILKAIETVESIPNKNTIHQASKILDLI